MLIETILIGLTLAQHWLNGLCLLGHTSPENHVSLPGVNLIFLINLISSDKLLNQKCQFILKLYMVLIGQILFNNYTSNT